MTQYQKRRKICGYSSVVERHLAKVHVARSNRVTRCVVITQFYRFFGKVAEWLNASVLKTDVVARLPGVRIPPFPEKILK